MRIHGAAVIALWSISAAWIAGELTFPPHRPEGVLWRASVALACTLAASTASALWYFTKVLIEPINSQQYALRIGYEAGRGDGQSQPGATGTVHQISRVAAANGKH